MFLFYLRLSSGIKGCGSTNKRIGQAWRQPVYRLSLKNSCSKNSCYSVCCLKHLSLKNSCRSIFVNVLKDKQKNRPGVTKGRRLGIVWTSVSIVWLKNICSKNSCYSVCCLKHLSLTNSCLSIFVNSCYESYHLLGRLLFETSAGPSVFVSICHESYHLLQKHLLQKQLLLPTMEPSAGHVIKYYKGVLDIMYVAVGIKKLMKTNKFEIIVRRSGSLVVSVPSGSNSTLATT